MSTSPAATKVTLSPRAAASAEHHPLVFREPCCAGELDAWRIAAEELSAQAEALSKEAVEHANTVSGAALATARLDAARLHASDAAVLSDKVHAFVEQGRGPRGALPEGGGGPRSSRMRRDGGRDSWYSTHASYGGRGPTTARAAKVAKRLLADLWETNPRQASTLEPCLKFQDDDSVVRFSSGTALSNADLKFLFSQRFLSQVRGGCSPHALLGLFFSARPPGNSGDHLVA